MDHRGSKSITEILPMDSPEFVIVKEQRVDGSSEKLNSVRCTLVAEKSVFKLYILNSKGKRFTIYNYI